MKKTTILTAGLMLALVAAACGDGAGRDGEAAAGSPPAPPVASIDPADFSPTITHPVFPRSSVRTAEFTGTKRQGGGRTSEIRVVSRLLERTEVVAGVTVAVVEVAEHVDGELLELTEDYFAQHRDGSVWYFGERVSDYEDGKVVGHSGQWLAGEGTSQPGLYLPAEPAVGQEFAPEQVPGVADERSKVLELGLEVTVPAGTFTGCVKIEDHDLLDDEKGLKYYCPEVGLVREEGRSGSTDLVRFA